MPWRWSWGVIWDIGGYWDEGEEVEGLDFYGYLLGTYCTLSSTMSVAVM